MRATACGAQLNATSGTFRSLDVSGNGQYENDLDCTWVIIVPENNIITLRFTSFNLQGQSAAGSCVDYIEVTTQLAVWRSG